MKARWLAAILAVVFATFVSGATFAQKHEHHWDKDHPVFDDHEHEVVNTWWGTHRDHPLIGFRVEDRLPADWEPTGEMAPLPALTILNPNPGYVHSAAPDREVPAAAPKRGFLAKLFGK